MKKICLFILVMLSLTGCKANNCDYQKENHIMYINSGQVVRFEFEESYEICDDKKQNLETKIVNVQLLNSLAQDTFKDINFDNMSLSKALSLYEDSINDSINEVTIYSTSAEDYSSYLSYGVKEEKYAKEEIDSALDKTIPYNTPFEIKVEVAMEFYLEYYEFLNDNEVRYTTKYQCYGECDANEVYKYTAEYDLSTDKILITIKDGYDTKYTYSFSDNSFTYGDKINE